MNTTAPTSLELATLDRATVDHEIMLADFACADAYAKLEKVRAELARAQARFDVAVNDRTALVNELRVIDTEIATHLEVAS